MTISSNPRVSPTNSVEDTPTDRPPMAMTAVPQAVAMGAASASASTNPAAAAASPSSITETNLTPESANTAGSSCGSEVNGVSMIQQPSLGEAEHREPSTTSMVPTAGTSASSSTSSSVLPSQSITITMKDKAGAPKKTITVIKKTTTLKKKKKPKKRKFSSILSGMMQKSRTESNSLQYERDLLRKHLGGGNFRKVEQI